MALVKGNKTTGNPTPGGTTLSWTHNQDAGADGFLVVLIAQNNSQSVSGITYNGVSMTQIHTRENSAISTRYTAYGIQAPATGNNTVEITFSAGVWNPVVYCAQSFTGSGGAGLNSTTALENSPNSESLSVSANSILFCGGLSSYTISGITIDGTLTQSPNFDVDGSVNGKRFTGEFSGLLASGSRTGSVDTGSPTFQVSNFLIEITEAGGGGPVVDTDNFFLMN